MRSIEVDLHIKEEMTKTDESHIENDSRMGLLVLNVGYQRGFTTTARYSPEIAKSVRIKRRIFSSCKKEKLNPSATDFSLRLPFKLNDLVRV